MTQNPTFKVRNLPDQVADHIVGMLATGDLKPGQRLFEKELCVVLGVSRIPVREALRLLQAQGVVRTEPNRGSFIIEYGSDDTLEMLELRVAVERAALRRLLQHSLETPETLLPLKAALDDLEKIARLEDQLSYCRADLNFHATLVDQAGSPMLKPIWQSLARGVFVFLMHEQTFSYDYDASIRDHERLVALLEQRDAAELDQEIERHILKGLVGKDRFHKSA